MTTSAHDPAGLLPPPPPPGGLRNPSPALLQCYRAIERTSEQMLRAAREGQWDQVMDLESTCSLLIAQLRQVATDQALGREERQLKSRIMQRILRNDAQLRHLAEPWLDDLGELLEGRPQLLH